MIAERSKQSTPDVEVRQHKAADSRETVTAPLKSIPGTYAFEVCRGSCDQVGSYARGVVVLDERPASAAGGVPERHGCYAFLPVQAPRNPDEVYVNIRPQDATVWGVTGERLGFLFYHSHDVRYDVSLVASGDGGWNGTGIASIRIGGRPRFGDEDQVRMTRIGPPDFERCKAADAPPMGHQSTR